MVQSPVRCISPKEGRVTLREPPTSWFICRGTRSPASMSPKRFHTQSPGLWIDNPDAVGGRPLDTVSAVRVHCHHRLRSVDIEMGSGTGSPVCSNRDTKILPLGAFGIAERPEPDQSSLGRDEGSAHQTSSRSEHGRLSVAVAVAFAQGQRPIPGAPCRRQENGGAQVRVDAHHRCRESFVVGGVVAARRWLRITFSMCSRFSWNPGNGPRTVDIVAEVA